MTWAVVGIAATAAVVSLVAASLAMRMGRRLGALDAEGSPGQIKAPIRAVPNTGGIGIAVGVLLPIGVALAAAWLRVLDGSGQRLAELARGIRSESALAAWFLGSALAVHALGLVDDRRPLGWAPKLAVMLAAGGLLAWQTDTRILTAFDAPVGGAWLSILITALWFAVVMNAINFMDNMDGLAAGTAGVCAMGIASVALLQGQWLIAAGGALTAGACAGFLPLNYPKARLFMGDGGSLLIGFLLAFLTTRLTYLDPALGASRWDRLAVPLVLLAVPLYDFTSVVLIRLSQGKSPFVGDLQHLSHRFERRGISRPVVSASVWALSGITVLGAVSISRGSPEQTVLVLAQTLLTLLLLAALERSTSRRVPP
jgi:UDP-GlcNAc:undecaprenyl-phosphate GlcNAc-1-phosphate transferase